MYAINEKTFRGTWGEIKKWIIQNYDKYVYLCYLNPDTKKESVLIASKYTKAYLKKATINDIKRMSVR